MKAQDILDAVDALRLGCPDPSLEITEAIARAAERTAIIAKYDELGIYINVYHCSTRDNPWMFDMRWNGLLRGSFEGVNNRFPTREDAEKQAIEIAESVVDGTYALRYTS